jgi:hypothetical protein
MHCTRTVRRHQAKDADGDARVTVIPAPSSHRLLCSEAFILRPNEYETFLFPNQIHYSTLTDPTHPPARLKHHARQEPHPRVCVDHGPDSPRCQCHRARRAGGTIGMSSYPSSRLTPTPMIRTDSDFVHFRLSPPTSKTPVPFRRGTVHYCIANTNPADRVTNQRQSQPRRHSRVSLNRVPIFTSPITHHPSPITHHPSPLTPHPSPLVPPSYQSRFLIPIHRTKHHRQYRKSTSTCTVLS